MRKLIIFLLFIVFTVVAIGVVSFAGSFSALSIATKFEMFSSAALSETETTEINGSLTSEQLALPEEQKNAIIEQKKADKLQEKRIAATFEEGANLVKSTNLNVDIVGIVVQIVHAEVGEAYSGAIRIVTADEVIAVDNTVDIEFYSIVMWLFFLFLIILLPKRISKRKVRRLAEDVVDEAQVSAPRRRSRRRDYDDDDDYDD